MPSSIPNVVLNVDLAPTFLDMAGIAPPPHMDGNSFLPVLEAAYTYAHEAGNRKGMADDDLDVPAGLVDGWRQTFLIERG